MDILKVFFLAMTPIGELRLSIPVAILVYGINPFLAYFISVIGNLIPVFFIISFLNFFSDYLSKKSSFFCTIFSFIFNKTRKTHSLKIKRYGIYALIIFVAIPLPITGAWTASLIAFVFGIPFRKAFPLIASGVMISGLIVISIVGAGITIGAYIDLEIILGIAILIIFGILFYRSRKRKDDNFLIFK